MPPHISLNELYAMRNKKQSAKTICFDKALETCHRRIRTVASYGGMNTFYEVPGMLIGYPLYNVHECCNYIIESLRKIGFLVQVLPPPHVAVIYISWDPQDLKPKKSSVPTLGGPSAPASAPKKGKLRLF